MSGPRFTVFARAANLANLGTIDGYTEPGLTATPRFNAVGSWSLTYPVGSLGADLLKAAGSGVRIFRRDAPAGTDPIITGPVVNFVETLGDRKIPQVQFTGVCDNTWLDRRLALPVPATSGSTYTSAYDTRTGPAETIMRQYVNLNAGPGAQAVRRVVGLSLAADLARGGSASYSARGESLLQVCQNIAASHGLGFKVQHIGAGLVFTVYSPVDRRKLVRFSVGTRSLGAYSYGLTAPTATTVYVGDAQAGTSRVFAKFTDTTAEADWGRVEAFVDQSATTDTTQVAQAGAQALDAGSPQAAVTFEPRDTPQHRYGVDYGLGDTVTVRVRMGDVIDVVREVTITDDDNGVAVRPTVGGAQASDPASAAALYKVLNGLARAVGYLQRRL